MTKLQNNAHTAAHDGRRLSARKMQFLAIATAFLLAALLATFSSVLPAERLLQNARDFVHAKPASQQIHLVEIDAKSLQELDRWPWPRSYHAQLVDQLNKAGVDQIVFDIDFSSRSTSSEDAAFADALARAGGKVVLPTFRQAANTSGKSADIEILPTDKLRPHVFLGAVNVRPDNYGQVNSYPYGMITAGRPRPSIGVLLADADGRVGSDFKIDQSIEIATIPRHSFSDIIAGRVDLTALKGKKVIIGATAIEMGDRYATKRFGVIPGVVIQALAAETLIADTALTNAGPWPLLFGVGLFLLLMTAIFRQHGTHTRIYTGILACAVISIALLTEQQRLIYLEAAPALFMIIAFVAARHVVGLNYSLRTERTVDSDTGLPNLNAWQQQSTGPQITTVISAELHNFDEILSTLGKAEIAQFVTAVADRLAFAAGDIKLYRVGRKQFCWSADETPRLMIESTLESASRLFNAPIFIGGRHVRATISFGVSVDSLDDPTALLNKAILAAKKAGETGARTVWHDDILAQETDQSLFILSEFEEALVTGQISVVYQPKFSLSANRVTGAEALSRWRHPVKGAISPSTFVPVLEQEGLMEAFTLFVLNQVTAEVKRWNACGSELTCSLNISATLLADQSFVDRAIDIILQSEVPADQLTIELTESAALLSLGEAVSALNRFRKLGARLSIDDYGTGQSTLSYLKEFAADEIKIDQQFVKTIATDESNRIMVASTIALAKALNMTVVAEGVEDKDAMAQLRALGCDAVQGWFIGKPLGKDAFVNTWCQAEETPIRRALPG